MIFYITIIVSVLGLLIATYTDLKERIVTNKLNFGLAILGLIIYGTQSILESNPTLFIFSIFGLCFGFFFGWILWKAGVFAGGDVKLFMALGALNPFTPAILKLGMFTNSSIPIFPLTLFIYSLISFFPYGMFVVLYKLSKNAPFRKKLLIETKKRVADGIHFSIFSGALYTILSIIGISSLIMIPLIIIWGLIKQKNIVTIIITFAGIILSPILVIQNFLSTLIIVVILYGIVKLMLSLRPLLASEVKINKLEEGMIPAKTLYWENKKVKEAEPLSIKKIIELTRSNKIKEIFAQKNEIISAMKARGLINEEIIVLKKLAKEGKIPKVMQIKESMPFVPTMLLGYLLCLILGDAIFIVLLGM